MDRLKNISLALAAALLASCGGSRNPDPAPDTTALPDSAQAAQDLRFEQEAHLANVRQLTFAGDNAEAYFSFNDKGIIFQAKNPAWDAPCDQIFYFPFADGDMKDRRPQLVSTGKGRTTCSFFLPGDTTVLYASTHLGADDCPAEPPRDNDRYVWPVYPSYDIFVADLQGNILRQLTQEPGYDAEATVSPNGDKIVFTSDRSGDLELWLMNIDGSNPVQVTKDLGYDGGAFFSPDGKQLVFRASRPETPEDIQKYKSLLAEGLVEPSDMEIFVCDLDGGNLRQITQLGKANWAPYFHPSGQRVLFSSNHASERGFGFNIYSIKLDGTGLEQITFDEIFASFPMFSYDGKKLIFSSNRNAAEGTYDTNLFIADWVD